MIGRTVSGIIFQISNRQIDDSLCHEYISLAHGPSDDLCYLVRSWAIVDGWWVSLSLVALNYTTINTILLWCNSPQIWSFPVPLEDNHKVTLLSLFECLLILISKLRDSMDLHCEGAAFFSILQGFSLFLIFLNNYLFNESCVVTLCQISGLHSVGVTFSSPLAPAGKVLSTLCHLLPP